MAIIKCKLCGGDLVLSEDQSVAECEYCGSRQTVPKADDEKKLLLFDRAERLRKNCEFDKAAGLYESIVADFRQESEAYWGLVLCRYGIEYVDDPATGKKVPTCHRSSFESILEDPDLDQALENADITARRIYREESKQIEELRKGIIAVSAGEEPYDIFICYKETDEYGDRTLDSVLAQDIYDALTGRGYRVFFSRISLEDKLGVEYEPYIFAALNSAKIMLAVGTDYEYYNAVWVKNEWSRFLKLMAKDKQKHLIPCYKGLDAYDMPKEFTRLQAQDLGKVGAMQDLLRGIEKLLPRAPKTVVVQPKPVVISSRTPSVEPLLERIRLFLEDRDFESAETYCERVLDTDPKNALAYLYKFLISQRHPNLESLVKARISALKQPQGEKQALAPNPLDIRKYIDKYLIPNYLTDQELRNLHGGKTPYTTYSAGWRKLKASEETFWNSNRDLNRAIQFASGSLSEQIVDARDRVLRELDRKIAQTEQQDADALAAAKQRQDEMLRKADIAARELHSQRAAQRDAYYEELVEEIGSAHAARLAELAESFRKLGSYRDSELMAIRCQELSADADRESKYREYLRIARSSHDLQELTTAAEGLSAFRDREDCEETEKLCRERISAVKHLIQQQEEQRKRKALQEQKEKQYAKLAQIKKDQRFYWIKRILSWANLLFFCISFYRYLTVSDDLFTAWFIFFLAYMCYLFCWYWFKRGEMSARYPDFPFWLRHRLEYLKSEEHNVRAELRRLDEQRSEEEKQAEIAKQKAQMEVRQQNIKHALTKLAIFAAIILGIVIAIVLTRQLFIPMYHYNAGETAQEAGDYANAAIRYGKAGTYRDSHERSMEMWDLIAVRDAISAGGSNASGSPHHTVCLGSNGIASAVGNNKFRQCNVSGWSQIISVSAGGAHTVGLRRDGTVIAVGDNTYGQCNVREWTDIVAIKAGVLHTVGLRKDGTVVAVGDNAYGQCAVAGWTDIIAITAGMHTIGLKADGTVVATGYNEEGQCNVDGWTDITAISGTAFYTIGLKADGSVVAVGSNYYGQCEVAEWTDIVDISAGFFHTVGLKSDGTAVATGYNEQGQCDVTEWTDIVDVCTGVLHTVGLRSNGTAVAIGWNEHGQCDVAEWTNIRLPD